jgi:hypothetical protein
MQQKGSVCLSFFVYMKSVGGWGVSVWGGGVCVCVNERSVKACVYKKCVCVCVFVWQVWKHACVKSLCVCVCVCVHPYRQKPT